MAGSAILFVGLAHEREAGHVTDGKQAEYTRFGIRLIAAPRRAGVLQMKTQNGDHVSALRIMTCAVHGGTSRTGSGDR